MGKSKKQSGKSAAAKAPVCNCEHPFKCDCGNRPERPSKGHKWDFETKTWGGKGHKQKGASGQTASVGQQAKTTAVGQTTLQQWQRLPSQILEEISKRKKWLRPKYKNVEKKQKLFKYRIILPDGKDPDKDRFFVPANGVTNEEQAKEEACLLALLHITPELPHEKKLPDPYKETWLNAVAAQKESNKQARRQQQQKVSTSSSSRPPSSAPTSSKKSNSGAQASTSLTMGSSFASVSERRKVQQEKQRIRNARMRRVENIKQANQNHPVFMSASIRGQIERLLRGDTNFFESLDGDDDEVADEAENEVQEIVEDQLHLAGFTKRQARASYNELKNRGNDREDWGSVYEECLQWLLIHLDEDQLPEGFDPRGGTLHVETSITIPPQASTFSAQYGVSKQEALLIYKRAEDSKRSMHAVLYDAATTTAGVSTERDPVADTETNLSLLKDELEAMDAIFGQDYQVSCDSGITSISIEVEESGFALKVSVRDGEYPSLPPLSVTVKSKWVVPLGTIVHVEVARFVAELSSGDPMLFEIHNYVNEIFGSLDEYETKPKISLVPTLKGIAPAATVVDTNGGTKPKTAKPKHRENRRPLRRPRERSPFWSKMPTETPSATAMPTISTSLASVRRSLPAAGVRGEFLSKLDEADKGGRVLLVTGETGSGKTTQIPQFILEEFPSTTKIVVCQPRRIAATGVANRVAEERGEKQPGQDSVGYVVRGDTAICARSRLVFCTTGVLLRQLQSEGALDCLTHVLVDEVHERQLDTDILLGLLKQSLPQYKNLRVVLMSATLDADRFAGYWGKHTPRMHIPGRTFPVNDYHLEDVLSLTGFVPRKQKKRPGDKEVPEEEAEPNNDNDELDQIGGHGMTIRDLVNRVDQTSVDYDLLATLIRHLVRTNVAGVDGSILVFLPGAPEINRAADTIKKCASGQSILVLPLHGGLQPREQSAVFRSAGRGCTKIVLSTNVAETSITIPDCTIVVDCAREKQSSYDPVNRMPMLVEQFCSQASLKQRRANYVPTENLRFKGVFMRTLLDPPSQKALDGAVFSLVQVGAVELGTGTNDLVLTPLGMQLAGIPAPPAVGKIMILGSILGCRDAALAMAAGMSVGRSPFLRIDTPRRRKNEEVDDVAAIQEMKNELIIKQRTTMSEAVGSSDHAFLAYVFMEWQKTGTGGGHRKTFCEKLGLSFNGMRDILQLARQLDSSLAAAGYHASEASNRNSYSWRIIRSCAVAALSPGQLVKVVRPAKKYHDTAEGALEKDGEARQLKFFVRTADDQDSSSNAKEERVFIHPSSANFTTGDYSCPWLVYHTLIRTSKPFLRDVTECSAYALLLFGGRLDVNASEGVIIVDGWAALSATARIGSLMAGLRLKVDDFLRKKVVDPAFDIEGCKEMDLIVKLLATDGLGIYS